MANTFEIVRKAQIKTGLQSKLILKALQCNHVFIDGFKQHMTFVQENCYEDPKILKTDKICKNCTIDKATIDVIKSCQV